MQVIYREEILAEIVLLQACSSLVVNNRKYSYWDGSEVLRKWVAHVFSYKHTLDLNTLYVDFPLMQDFLS
jgi:hypothetical protein